MKPGKYKDIFDDARNIAGMKERRTRGRGRERIWWIEYFRCNVPEAWLRCICRPVV